MHIFMIRLGPFSTSTLKLSGGPLASDRHAPGESYSNLSLGSSLVALNQVILAPGLGRQ